MRLLARNDLMAVSFAILTMLASTAIAKPGFAASPKDTPAGMPPMMHHQMGGHGAPAMSPPDEREEVHFPPQMQTTFLHNMRDHLETLNDIMQAIGDGEFAEASKIARERLGLDSPSAAGCKPSDTAANGSPTMSKPAAPGSMEEMMALYMPKHMREIGLAMHTAASEFATVAAQAAVTHDTASVIGALSRITPQCVTCHSSYRLQ